MTPLAGRTAFVTGAASGIGLGIATALSAAGVNVMMADIEEAALARAVEGLRRKTNAQVDGVVVDVSLRSSLEQGARKTIERFGKVHILISNAGVGGQGPLNTWSTAGWEWILGVNLMAVAWGFEIFVPLMEQHGEGGHVLATASMAGLFSGSMTQYNVTKFGVVAMCESLRPELQPKNIGVSVLCPGFVRTRIMESGRNIPDRLGGPAMVARPMPPPGTPGADLVQMVRQRIETGLDPLVVGDLVREAIEANDLYVFTDAEFEPLVKARHAAIDAAFAKIRARQTKA